MASYSDSIATKYAVWQCVRSFLHRGWWTVTSVYLVTEAELSAFQLVFLGTAQGLTVLAAEVPTGVLADHYSRKWSIVISHALMGLGMLATGLVDSFPALVVTQMVWGLSWTFSTGADVAWLTDEMDQPEQTAAAITRGATWGQAGSAVGILVFGAFAWAVSLSLAIVVAGAGMWVVGAVFAFVFPETRFRRSTAAAPVRAAFRTLQNSYRSISLQHTVLVVLLGTFLVNGADEAFGRLYAKHLLDLGLSDGVAPVVWLAGLATLTLGCGAIALAVLGKWLQRTSDYGGAYALGCGIGVCGLLVFVLAPTALTAMAGVLLASGVAWTVLRTVGVVWVNEHATSDVRATVQSFLSIAEHLGEITIGFCLALLARAAGIDAAIVGSTCVVLLALLVVWHHRQKAMDRSS